MSARRVLAAPVLLLLLAAPPALAAPRALTGSAPKGTTVIALAASGQARVVRARPRFRLVPPRTAVTVHLRDRRGRYAGPLVVGRKGSRVIVGLRAGARIGRLVLRPGYARPVRRMRERFLDRRRTALSAGAGVPLGARGIGLVRSTRAAAAGPGRDQDLDGVTGAFDLDDDGDLVLDNVDRDGATARAAQTPAPGLDPFSLLPVALAQSYVAEDLGLAPGGAGYALNDYASAPGGPGSGDLALRQRGLLLFPLVAGEEAELDCGSPGLSYCTRGGSGTLPEAGGPPAPFPDPADENGFGTMTPIGAFFPQRDGVGTTPGLDASRIFALHHGAPASALQPGDTFIERLAGGGARTVALHYAFTTVPAIAAWSIGDGPKVTVEYPVPRSIGQTSAEIGSTGDIVLNLDVWPPQRPAIPGSAESGRLDIGRLIYSVGGFDAANRPWRCPDADYSTSDPGLLPGSGGVVDQRADRPVTDAATARNSATLRSFAVNLSRCLRASGLGDLGQAPAIVSVTARTDFGDAAEGGGLGFRRSAFSGTWDQVAGSADREVAFEFSPHAFSTSAFGIKVPAGLQVTGGSAPAGWSCAPSTSSAADDTYRCQGATAAPGERVAGQITLSGPIGEAATLDLITRRAADTSEETGFRLNPR